MNFFVCGLPRSRTAWFSTFLTYKDKFCYHEGIDGCETIEDYKAKLGTDKGDSDTCLMLLDMNTLFPDAPKVIIERDVQECIESASKMLSVYINPEYFYFGRDRLDKIDGLRISYDDINDRLEEIWNYLIPDIEFDSKRAKRLCNDNVQDNRFDYDFDSINNLILKGACDGRVL